MSFELDPFFLHDIEVLFHSYGVKVEQVKIGTCNNFTIECEWNDRKQEEEEIDDISDEEDTMEDLTEIHVNEMIETTLLIMEEYMEHHPTIISEPNFHELLLEAVKELFYVQLEDFVLDDETLEYDINTILEYAYDVYMSTICEQRSFTNPEPQTLIMSPSTTCSLPFQLNLDFSLNDVERKTKIGNHIQFLKSIPQPSQRSKEWYEFRWNLITASNAWKAFGSQSVVNQLIYEKCQPLNVNEDKSFVNYNSTLHWGQKYEPLSIMLYEDRFKTKVEDFGCIRHPNDEYKFLGASPDGIVVDENSNRFGRMLEIKNIVNREINGIPKKEYWIQMQLQMEVCDLDDCDFLETKFKEYGSKEEFMEDTKAVIGETKGMIIFYNKPMECGGGFFYDYMPLSIKSIEEMEKWIENSINKYDGTDYKYNFVTFNYWKLEIFSCVLVKRNRMWFKNSVSQLENVWKTIEKERQHGYEHRAPIKQAKKTPIVPAFKPEICVLKLP